MAEYFMEKIFYDNNNLLIFACLQSSIVFADKKQLNEILKQEYEVKIENYEKIALSLELNNSYIKVGYSTIFQRIFF